MAATVTTALAIVAGAVFVAGLALTFTGTIVRRRIAGLALMATGALLVLAATGPTRVGTW